jgi:hypothetical protein
MTMTTTTIVLPFATRRFNSYGSGNGRCQGNFHRMVSFGVVLMLWLGIFPMAVAQSPQQQQPPVIIDGSMNGTTIVGSNINNGGGGSGGVFNNVTNSNNGGVSNAGGAVAPDAASGGSAPTTAAPSPPSIAAVGTVNLELISTPRLLAGDSLTLFLATTEEFLGEKLFASSPDDINNQEGSSSVISSPSVPLMADAGLSLTLIRQSRSILRRHLQSQSQQQQQTRQPLYVTLEVAGRSTQPTKIKDMNVLLERIFIEHGAEYVTALQQSSTASKDDIFAPSLTQVNVLLESTLGATEGDNDSAANGGGDDAVGNEFGESDVAGRDEVDEPVPANPPVEAPTPQQGNGDGNNEEMPVVVVNDNSNEGTSDGADTDSTTSPLSQSAIIGIAAGGGAVVLLLVLGCFLYCFGCLKCYCCRRDKDDNVEESAAGTPSGSTSGSKTRGSPTGKKNMAWMRNAKKEQPPEDDSLAEHNILQTASSSTNKFGPDSESASDMTSDHGDLESQAMYSYNPRGDSGSVYTFNTYNNNTLVPGGSHSVMGNDNMSYAYSLEPGIEPSVIGHRGTSNDNASLNPSLYGTDDDSLHSRIPIREIPNIFVAAASSSNQQQNSGSRSRQPVDNLEGTQIETTPSDLHLTPSEIAMLPSNLRSDDDDDEKANNTGVTDPRTYVRSVSAPSGKLGIVIDTTVNGPVVHQVNDGSKLIKKIFPGDIIVAIDDVDTRAMSASAITSLMIKTAGRSRTLKVRGPPPPVGA